MAMKITLCFSLFLMAGCTGAPGVSGFGYGDKTACVNLNYGKVYLVIVTDGEMGAYGVSAGLFRPPHFFGTLEPRTIRLSYSAWGQRLSIGDDKYDLTQGRLFAVSFATGTPVIHQINMSPRGMVRAFLENNAELKEFFQDNSPKQPTTERGE
jgi:hypothetical protein